MGHQYCRRRDAWPYRRASGSSRVPHGPLGLRCPLLSLRTLPGANISTHAQAAEQLKPDATAIYVAAHQATAAIEEAIEAEIPLIVAVAEHIPLHNMLRVSTAIVADLGYVGFPPHSDRSRSNPCLNRNLNPASSAPTRLASSLLWGDAG